eukprot:scaffold35168_cov31-Tisochrysis_lutea.AAC.4
MLGVFIGLNAHCPCAIVDAPVGSGGCPTPMTCERALAPPPGSDAPPRLARPAMCHRPSPARDHLRQMLTHVVCPHLVAESTLATLAAPVCRLRARASCRCDSCATRKS